jgi:hypothetical protein
MKLELLLEALKTLKDEWFPLAKEGESQKIRITAGGLALLIAFVAIPVGYYKLQSIQSEQASFRTEFREFKGLVWNALVQQGRVAKAEPAKESPTAAPFRGFIPSAEADDGVVGAGVSRGLPAADAPVVGPGHVSKEKR